MAEASSTRVIADHVEAASVIDLVNTATSARRPLGITVGLIAGWMFGLLGFVDLRLD